MAVPGARPDPDPDPALLSLAKRVQATFLNHGQTLNDLLTVEAYRTTLQVVRDIHAAARGAGVLSESQYEALRGMVEAAAKAPEVL